MRFYVVMFALFKQCSSPDYHTHPGSAIRQNAYCNAKFSAIRPRSNGIDWFNDFLDNLFWKRISLRPRTSRLRTPNFGMLSDAEVDPLKNSE